MREAHTRVPPSHSLQSIHRAGKARATSTSSMANPVSARPGEASISSLSLERESNLFPTTGSTRPSPSAAKRMAMKRSTLAKRHGTHDNRARNRPPENAKHPQGLKCQNLGVHRDAATWTPLARTIERSDLEHRPTIPRYVQHVSSRPMQVKPRGTEA